MTLVRGWTPPDLLDARAVLRIGCEHPAAVNITTLSSPTLQFVCGSCGAQWEREREVTGWWF